MAASTSAADVAIDLGTFKPLADLLPEPMLVVQADGTIRAVNRAFAETFGWRGSLNGGVPLAQLLATPGDEVAEFLRHCAATSGFLLKSLTFRHDGMEVAWRAEGAALRAAATPDERLVVLRLTERESAVARFAALTRQLGDLSAEVVGRRRAERAAADALDCERRLRDRLTALAEASGELVASLAVDDVLPAIGRLAVRLVPADAHAVWYRDTADGAWKAVWHENVAGSLLSAIAEVSAEARAEELLTQPLYVENVADVPALSGRREKYAAEGILSLVVIPLRVNGGARGTVVAYHRRQVPITADDRCVATALGNLASSALATATLYAAESASRRAAQLAADRAAFLARASNVLASSLDYESTLKTVAQLAVPEMADWCAVDVATEHGELRRLAVAHEDPEKVRLAWALHERYPPDPESPYGAMQALRTGRSVMMSRIPPELIEQGVRDADHLAMVRSLGLTSYMCVPLVVRGRAVGVITFVAAESGCEYTASHLRFAEDVASRAALAVENARAYDAVQRANRVKDEFLATLSHELRTPLNAVLGYARMIRSGMLDTSKQGRALEILERNAVSLNQIVEDILDVSRIVAGKLRLAMTPVDLSGVLHDAAATVRPAADAKGIALTMTIDPDVPPISGDADRLQQVVWNLLANAVKFTPRQGRVHLRLAQAGSRVQVTVRDSGAGIHRDFLPHLFEAFRQGDSGFAREHGGLGLGLAIARHLVEMHGGTIAAASEGEGRGATFTVEIPVMAVRHDEQPAADAALANPAATQPPARVAGELDGLHVLVVDDDADARTLVCDILHSAGARASTADSAPAALLRLEDEELPDVILTDVGMPGMDGFEMIARLRQSPRPALREVPAVALTAYARSEDRLRALEQGCQLHLAKPVNPLDLVEAIRKAAGRGDAPLPAMSSD